YTCQFTTGSMQPTASNAVYLTQYDTTLRKYYIDDVSVLPVKTVATVDDSGLQISGASPSATLVASQSGVTIEKSTTDTTSPYIVKNAGGQPVTATAVYQTATIGNLHTGSIDSDNINVQSLTLAGQSLGDRLANLENSATNSAQLSSKVATLSNSVNSLNDRVASLEATVNLMASGSALLSENPFSFAASSAAELDLDKLTINSNLSVLGKTTVADLGV